MRVKFQNIFLLLSKFSRLESSEDALTILNILGYHGFHVVGVGNSMDNRMVWTLERKYFEFHKDEL